MSIIIELVVLLEFGTIRLSLCRDFGLFLRLQKKDQCSFSGDDTDLHRWSCERSDKKNGGIGGALVNQDASCIRHFSFAAPSSFMRVALEKSENPIYELELLPFCVSIVAWKPLLQRHVVFYLGKDAVRAAVCKGVGSTTLAQRIVRGIIVSECAVELKSWCARVPTHSNIFDGPSRLDCSELLQVGSIGTEADLNKLLEGLLA